MLKVWKRQNINDRMSEMDLVCAAALFLLFFEVVKFPIIANHLVLPCILIFELYLFLNRKELMLDKRFFILLIAMAYHVVIYSYFVEKMELGEFMDLALLPALFYLLGKQLLYYPQEGKNTFRRIGIVVAVVLVGHFVLSWLEIYAYYINPDYPARIWYDFWIGEEIYATQYSFFSLAWMALFFYGFWILRKNILLGIGLLFGLFIINALNIFNGNRMHLGILIVVFVFCLGIFLNENKRNRKLVFFIVVGTGCLLGGGALMVGFNVNGVREIPYVQRLFNLTTDVRFEIYRNALAQVPLYLWGGDHMDLGGFAHAHNFWLQLDNESGIITFILMCVFTILNILDCIKIIVNPRMKEDIKYIIPPICMAFFLYLTFERGGKYYIALYALFCGMAAQIIQMKKEEEKRVESA